MESLTAAEKFCFLATCRRKFLLQYFGEKAADECGKCDNCTMGKKQRDLSRECFLLLSCIKSCGRWGVNMPVDILRGSRSKKIVEYNFDKLPMHGLGKDYSSTWWKAFAVQLITHGYLKENFADIYRTISVSPMGLQFISSADTLQQAPLILPLTTEMVDEEEQGHQQNKMGDLPNAATLACEGFSEVESKMFFMLLDARFRLAKQDGTAPYAICGDETIKRLTKLRPSTRARLANIDGINQYFVTRYGDELLTSINQLSKELNLPTNAPPRDCEGTVQTAITKKVCANLEKNLTPAKFDAWKLWQQSGISFREISEYHRKSCPIKEQTVISYIIDAARQGCELNWPRFCKETGLTLEIASQIHNAISKVGSRDRLKPIKEELPESVSYDNIKVYLTMEELGLSAEEILSCDSVSKVPEKTLGSPPLNVCNDKDEQDCETITRSTNASPTSPVAPCHGDAHVKQPRSNDFLHPECSPRKLLKHCESKRDCSGDLVATETSVLEWIRGQDGVSAVDVVKRFEGSEEESVLDLLTCLEGDFLIFKKNGLYRVM